MSQLFDENRGPIASMMRINIIDSLQQNNLTASNLQRNRTLPPLSPDELPHAYYFATTLLAIVYIAMLICVMLLLLRMIYVAIRRRLQRPARSAAGMYIVVPANLIKFVNSSVVVSSDNQSTRGSSSNNQTSPENSVINRDFDYSV